MSDGTKIEWTDATWNVVNGCSLKSPGCTNCYAMKQAHRFPVRQGLTTKTAGGMVWTGEVRFNYDVLAHPIRWKRARRIFVCAHGDLFHEAVPDKWIDRVVAVMALAPQHTFQVLTKRPERMRDYIRGFVDRPRDFGAALGSVARSAGLTERAGLDVIDSMVWPLPNVWLGTSVEDDRRAEERVPVLLDTPAAVRWLSCEPLLGPVLLTILEPRGRSGILNGLTGSYLNMIGDNAPRAGNGIDWVVAGGESGPGARPMDADWGRRLRDDCAAAGVPFLFKQWGDFDEEGRKVGKRTAGRLLDGVQHDGYPA